jgi:hypothetical protein
LGMVEAGTSVVHVEVIGRHQPIAPGIQVTHPIAAGRALRTEKRSLRKEAVESSILPPGVQVPSPVERLFPREILRQRRERRHAAVLAGDYAAHNSIPSLLLA